MADVNQAVKTGVLSWEKLGVSHQDFTQSFHHRVILYLSQALAKIRDGTTSYPPEVAMVLAEVEFGLKQGIVTWQEIGTSQDELTSLSKRGESP